MALSTAFTELLGVRHPIALAPMGGSAGGALPVWASEAIDLINDLPYAADLVSALAAQAEEALARAGRH